VLTPADTGEIDEQWCQSAAPAPIRRS
jgi:hypothetical protein